VVGAVETAQLSHETDVTMVVVQHELREALRASRRSLAQANAPRTRFAALDTTPSLQQHSPHPQSAATTAVEVVTVVTVVEVAHAEVAHAEVAHAEVL
jgi:ABC-type nitrate/sulfonate/bicarbonate transport system ATPase subunit